MKTPESKSHILANKSITLDRRLDCIPEFDERSRMFLVRDKLKSTKPIVNKIWDVPVWLDQGQEGACHKEGTEVLTERHGWRDFKDVIESDRLATVDTATMVMEYQCPTALQVLDFDGELVVSSNRSIQFAVTPDHRMMVRKWDEEARTLDGTHRMVAAKDLGWYCGLPVAPSGFVGVESDPFIYRGKPVANGDLFFFLGVFLADGCLYYDGNGNYRIELGAKKARKRVTHLQALHGIGAKPTVLWDRYTVCDKDLFVQLSACYGSGALTKRVPEFVRNAPEPRIKQFLEGFTCGDGHITKSGRTFLYTSSPGMAGDLQELYFKIGIRASCSKRDPKDVTICGRFVPKENCAPCYIVGPWKDKKKLSIERKDHLASEPYKGKVYCATVPNGTLVTRYKRTILISGNCVGFGYSHELLGDPVAVKGINDAFARALYKHIQTKDPWEGENYEGTSVLSGAKVCLDLGYFTAYHWATSAKEVAQAISHMGPVVIGVNWHEGMAQTSSKGFIRVTGAVRGGHCVVLRGVRVSAHADGSSFAILGRNSWGKGWGMNGDFWITGKDLQKLVDSGGSFCVPTGRADSGKQPPTRTAPRQWWRFWA